MKNIFFREAQWFKYSSSGAQKFLKIYWSFLEDPSNRSEIRLNMKFPTTTHVIYYMSALLEKCSCVDVLDCDSIHFISIFLLLLVFALFCLVHFSICATSYIIYLRKFKFKTFFYILIFTNIGIRTQHLSRGSTAH